MKRSGCRLLAAFLLPCLLIDPRLAAAFSDTSSAPGRCLPASYSSYNQQAIVGPLRAARFMPDPMKSFFGLLAMMPVIIAKDREHASAAIKLNSPWFAGFLVALIVSPKPTSAGLLASLTVATMGLMLFASVIARSEHQSPDQPLTQLERLKTIEQDSGSSPDLNEIARLLINLSGEHPDVELERITRIVGWSIHLEEMVKGSGKVHEAALLVLDTYGWHGPLEPAWNVALGITSDLSTAAMSVAFQVAMRFPDAAPYLAYYISLAFHRPAIIRESPQLLHNQFTAWMMANPLLPLAESAWGALMGQRGEALTAEQKADAISFYAASGDATPLFLNSNVKRLLAEAAKARAQDSETLQRGSLKALGTFLEKHHWKHHLEESWGILLDPTDISILPAVRQEADSILRKAKEVPAVWRNGSVFPREETDTKISQQELIEHLRSRKQAGQLEVPVHTRGGELRPAMAIDYLIGLGENGNPILYGRLKQDGENKQIEYIIDPKEGLSLGVRIPGDHYGPNFLPPWMIGALLAIISWPIGSYIAGSSPHSKPQLFAA